MHKQQYFLVSCGNFIIRSVTLQHYQLKINKLLA